MHSFISLKTITITAVLLAAGAIGAACSSESGSSSSGGGDTTSSAQGVGGSQTSSTTAGSGGAGGTGSATGAGGGSACGDTMTDPQNCGSCGNVCLPGLTCAAGACACDPAAMGSLANDVQPIFTKSCVKQISCHGSVAEGKLNLSNGKAYAQLVDVASQCADKRKRVTPMKPDESYILNKLTGKNMCSGKKMPENAPALAAANIATITNWICAGALNN